MTKNDEPILLEKRTIRDAFFHSAFHASHSFPPHFLKPITNRASEFFTIFIIRESTKTWRSLLKLNINTTYVFTGDRIRKVYPPQMR